jgi:hypothetical protein
MITTINSSLKLNLKKLILNQAITTLKRNKRNKINKINKINKVNKKANLNPNKTNNRLFNQTNLATA